MGNVSQSKRIIVFQIAKQKSARWHFLAVAGICVVGDQVTHGQHIILRRNGLLDTQKNLRDRALFRV